MFGEGGTITGRKIHQGLCYFEGNYVSFFRFLRFLNFRFLNEFCWLNLLNCWGHGSDLNWLYSYRGWIALAPNTVSHMVIVFLRVCPLHVRRYPHILILWPD